MPNVTGLLPPLRSTVKEKLSPVSFGGVVSEVPPINVTEVGNPSAVRLVVVFCVASLVDNVDVVDRIGPVEVCRVRSYWLESNRHCTQ